MRTAEVCQRLGLHRNTLFRWEKAGLIPPPDRTLRGERNYTADHLRAIAHVIHLRRHAEQYRRVLAQDGEDSLEQLRLIDEDLALSRFLHQGDATGLAELGEYATLSDSTLQALVRHAADNCEPASPHFWEIMAVVWKHHPA